jgi:hypothetical protein
MTAAISPIGQVRLERGVSKVSTSVKFFTFKCKKLYTRMFDIFVIFIVVEMTLLQLCASTKQSSPSPLIFLSMFGVWAAR